MYIDRDINDSRENMFFNETTDCSLCGIFHALKCLMEQQYNGIPTRNGSIYPVDI